MLLCKNCKSENKWKNGFVRGKQRYLCKDCGHNYVEGDERTNDKVKAKKAFVIMLYSLGKMSITMIAKMLKTWPSLVCRWLQEAAREFPEYFIDDNIKEIEFDEMWHFLKKN